VCDGATQDTLEAAHDLAEADDRVRLFIHDKGPRYGEIYRHEALQEATGTIVCYLADDDLWLPGHVAGMAALLESVDFAHAFPIGFASDGRLHSWPGQLSLGESRRSILEGRNFIPLSCGAHTLELYRRLPHGWRTTPPDTHTDLYMWQQIISAEDVRLASGNQPSVLHFASPPRRHMTLEERVGELKGWADAMVTRDFASDLDGQIHEFLMAKWVRSDFQVRGLDQRLSDAIGRISSVESHREGSVHDMGEVGTEREVLLIALERAREELTRSMARREEAQDRLAKAVARIETLEARVRRFEVQLASIARSRTWRTRAAVLRIPGMEWLARKAGRARSR